MAIRELIDCTSAAAETKIMKFAKALSNALNASNDFAVIELIADAFGHMARNSPVSHVDYLEVELLRSLDWLTRGKYSLNKKLAACMILQKLATFAPTIFFAKINEFFDLIWGPIWDPKENIRVVASGALSACLAVLKERTYHLQWYCLIYDQVKDGMKGLSEEVVHGSLLVLAEMLKYSGDFMIPRFNEVCTSMMQLKDHKSKLVRSAIIGLMPSLAKLRKDGFARTYMTESIDILLRSAKSSDFREQALLSIGKLCLSLGSHLINRMDEMMQVLRDSLAVSLANKGSKGLDVIAETLICISDMVQGLGAPFHSRVYSLIEPMLQTGLTAELIDTLSVISSYMPNQKALIQQRLLEEATKVLGGTADEIYVGPDYTFSWGRSGERYPKQNIGGISTSESAAALSPGVIQPIPSIASMQSLQSFTNLAAAGSSHKNRSMNNLTISVLSRNISFGPNSGGNRPHAPSITSPSIGGLGQQVSQKVKPLQPQQPKKGFFGNAFGRSNTPVQSSPSQSIGAIAIGAGLGLGSEKDNLKRNSQGHEIVLLSLKTLSSLSIPSMNTINIVQQSVLPYLISDDYHVRREAAITSAKMIASLISMRYTKGPTALAIEGILTRLLELVVSDTSVKARLSTLQCFNANYDLYLARSHHIHTLMLLLADESFEIRLEALNILGRLASANPATVLPPIRVHLSQLISEMASTPDYRAREEAASMLCRFMQFPKFHFLVRPVMSKVVDCLPLKGDVRATTAALETVGELSLVLQTDLVQYGDKLLPIIIANMFDHSSVKKQEVAVKTLGQFVKSTGLVVRPYLQYPQLLPKTLELLCRSTLSQSQSFRIELLRTVGLLGALEPHRYSAIVGYLQATSKVNDRGDTSSDEKAEKRSGGSHGLGSVSQDRDRDGRGVFVGRSGQREKERAESISLHEKSLAASKYDAPDWLKGSTDRRSNSAMEEHFVHTDSLLFGDSADAPSYLFMYEQSFMRSISVPPQGKTMQAKLSAGSDDFYPRVALASLIKILQDPALTLHHSTATQTIIQIFGGLGVRCVPFLEQIVPYFLQIIKKSASGLRESVLQQLAQLVAISGHYIKPYLPSILEILKDYWNDHLEFVLAIIQQIAITMNDVFAEYLPAVMPLLLSTLEIPRDVTYTTFRMNHGVLKPLEETLTCIKVLKSPLRPHLHLFVPKLCTLVSQLIELSSETITLQMAVMQTLHHLINRSKGALIEQCNVILSNLVHTICRVVIKSTGTNLPGHAELYNECIGILTAIAQQVGERILRFDSLILRATDGRGLDNSAYKLVSNAIKLNQWDEVAFAEEDEENISHVSSSSALSDQESNLMWIGGSSDRLNSQSRLSSTASVHAGIQKLILNQQQLARSWDVSQRSTANDWHEWLWRFNVDLLRESPSPTLRACAPLAQTYPPMARDLFHAAFVSCWHELSDQYQDSLVRALQTAFRSSTVPSEILQYLLNLAEFMEHDVEALPISLSILAELAQKSHAYAKALHYRELEFTSRPAECFETLININKKLDQYEAASGLLKVAKQIQSKLPEFKDFYTVQESWLAKLGYWDEALQKYEDKLSNNSKDSIAIAGKMKCLEALGRWEETVKLCEENLDNMRSEGDANKTKTYIKAAVIGARAAWSLNKWDLMDSFVAHLPNDNVDGSFMKAVLAVHADDYLSSQKYLEMTRQHLDKSITTLMSESYGRAYMPLIMVQQCSELEEIIEYKLVLKDAGLRYGHESAVNNEDQKVQRYGPQDFGGVPFRPNKHESISTLLASDSYERSGSDISTSSQQYVMEDINKRKQCLSEKWRRRIRGCCSTGRAAIPYWKYLLNGRRMIINENEDLDTWLEFVSLCRNGGNTALAERVLSAPHLTEVLLPPGKNAPDIQAAIMDRRVRFALLKQKWSNGNRQEALQGLENLVKNVRFPSTTDSEPQLDSSYLSCLLKLGEWKISILDPSQPIDLQTRLEELSIYSKATIVDPNNYRAAHQWGLSNYRAVEEARFSDIGRSSLGSLSSRLRSNRQRVRGPRGDTPEVPMEQVLVFVLNAIKGLMRALSLGTRKVSSSVMQDMLCILSLWFRYAKISEVNAALEAGLAVVPLDNWLGVLPQLIARIDHPNKDTRRLLHALIMRLGSKHPQALVYPLSVALKSPRGDRKEAAESLMNGLRQHSTKLIDQALLVSQELVRVAILWEEWWHWALEDASRLCFGEGNIQGMLDMLQPLYDTLDKGAVTLRESAFLEAYQYDLNHAKEYLQAYKKSMEERNLPIPTCNTGGPLASDNPNIQQAWEMYYSLFKRINAQIHQIHSLDLPSTSPSLAASTDLDLGIPGTYTVNGQAIRIKSFNSVIAIIRSKQRPRKLSIQGEDGQEYLFLLKVNPFSPIKFLVLFNCVFFLFNEF